MEKEKRIKANWKGKEEMAREEKKSSFCLKHR